MDSSSRVFFGALGAMAIGLVLQHEIGGDERVDKRIAKLATRGEQAWRTSCPKSHASGLCVDRVTAESPRTGKPTRCGVEGYDLVVGRRDTTLVTEATTAFREVVALYEKVGGKTGGNHAAALRRYVEARLALADLELERYLATAFSVDSLSTHRAQADRLRAKYVAIAAAGEPIGSIVAADRLGRIPQHLFEALLATPIPDGLADEEVDAYCDGVTAAATPHETAAADAFVSCVRSAQQAAADLDLPLVRVIADWSESCSGELGRILPAEYSALHEVVDVDALSDVEQRALLQIRMRNFAQATTLLSSIVTAWSYDHLNLVAIAARGQGHFDEAEAAYWQAIDVDFGKPAAFYNLALLHGDYRAPVASDLDRASAEYRLAIMFLDRAATCATGALHREIEEQLAIMKKTLAQVGAFQARSP